MPVAERSSSPRRRLDEVLARWRVPIGFCLGFLVLWLAQPTGVSLVAGAVVASAGEALRIWAAGHLKKSCEVTTSGPYQWLAHPLYVGSAILGGGLAIASANWLVAVLIPTYLGATIPAAVREEEAFLARSFEEQYARYRRGVAEEGALGSEAGRRFSASQAIANREHRAVAGLLAALLLLVLKATYNGTFWRAAETLVGPGG